MPLPIFGVLEQLAVLEAVRGAVVEREPGLAAVLCLQDVAGARSCGCLP